MEFSASGGDLGYTIGLDRTNNTFGIAPGSSMASPKFAVNAAGSITASGDISGSKIYGSNYKIQNFDLAARSGQVGITIGNENDGMRVTATKISLNAPVTASSHISASGHIQTSELKGDTNLGTGLEIAGFVQATNITASGHISASGTIIAKKIKAIGSDVTIENGHITASGNISSSGTVIANAFTGTLTGTATGLTGTPDITVGSLTANKITTTEFTSSFITSSIIVTEGSNTFGDANTDTHTFVGNITASGNISASGDDYVFGNVTIDSGKTFIGNTTNEAESNSMLTVGGGSGTAIKLYYLQMLELDLQMQFLI